MALSTQKGRSFYAFWTSNKHLRPLRGHVAESKYVSISNEVLYGMFHSLTECFFSSFYSMKQSPWQVGSINYFVDISYIVLVYCVIHKKLTSCSILGPIWLWLDEGISLSLLERKIKLS